MWHKGHFAKEKPRDTNTTKDIRLQEAGASLEVHRVVFTSQQAEIEKAEVEEMIKNEVPRENLVIFNLETKKMEVAFFQREVSGPPPVPNSPHCFITISLTRTATRNNLGCLSGQ